MSETTRAFRKTRVGTVISDKMDKTIVVAIATNVQHPLYHKTVSYTHLKCGIETTGAVAALTGIDEENVLIGMYIRKTWPKVKVITKVNRTSFQSIIDSMDLGLSLIHICHRGVNSTELRSWRMAEEMLYGEFGFALGMPPAQVRDFLREKLGG